jgi:hypothetical protein
MIFSSGSRFIWSWSAASLALPHASVAPPAQDHEVVGIDDEARWFFLSWEKFDQNKSQLGGGDPA